MYREREGERDVMSLRSSCSVTELSHPIRDPHYHDLRVGAPPGNEPRDTFIAHQPKQCLRQVLTCIYTNHINSTT